jgi:hypothetical protein
LTCNQLEKGAIIYEGNPKPDGVYVRYEDHRAAVEAETERLRAEMSQPRALLVEALQAACSENVKLREALEKIKKRTENDIRNWPRSGLAIIGQIARAALKEKP